MDRFKKLAVITISLNITVLALAITAWSQQNTKLPLELSISILLAIIAYGLMWVHYVSDWLKHRYWPKQSTGWQYGVSRWIVLIAILVHPILINAYLFQNNFGFPPGSYQKYFGTSALFFILLGIVSLAAFLAFEGKKWLEHKPIWQWIMHANNAAMLAIVIHGYKLGPITDSAWYFWVWTMQAVLLCAVLATKYITHTQKLIRYVGCFIIIFTLLVVGWQIVRYIKPENQAVKPATRQTTISPTKLSLITKESLAQKTGLNGELCWVAVSGKVYDATNNPQWQNGEHIPSNGRAQCGKDLSLVIKESPHGTSVLQDLPVVGNLE